ncbi:alpha/beta hydrolase fold protein [Tanacetum coccineum]
MALTKVGEQVLDLVIPYIHNLEDRNSLSLVSRKFYEIDGITRKRLTVHTLYYPNPASLSKIFPFIESLTLKGPLFHFIREYHNHIQITPWIEQLALEFRCLKQLRIRRLVVHDEDLETLATTRGKDLRSLKISKCEGYLTDGLRHVSKYCNQLTTLCLDTFIEMKDGIWLHQLALNNTVLERYVVGLEHFSGENLDEESDLVGIQLPPHMRSLRIEYLPPTQYSIVLPFLNQIRQLELADFSANYMCQCLLFKMCPNLEVLYPSDECGYTGLQVIGKFSKKLRKLNHEGLVTHVGLMALAKGCTKLECLEVRLEDISNEALECLGTHLKNLRKFRMHLAKEYGIIDPPLDNGIRAMLMGCKKLKRLDISLWHGGLTDVGLEYIGKYGANLRSLSLTRIGNSDA